LKCIGSKNKTNETSSKGASLKLDTAFESATYAVTETVCQKTYPVSGFQVRISPCYSLNIILFLPIMIAVAIFLFHSVIEGGLRYF